MKHDYIALGFAAGLGETFWNDSVHWLEKVGSGLVVAILAGVALRVFDKLTKRSK